MLETIIETAANSDYDFRTTAEAGDPMRHFFDDWVDYYRLKWAIAKVLQPARILELGVRFGYSALAFLSAAPRAHYIGIDNESDSFGGSRGSIAVAQAKLQSYSAQLIKGDTLDFQEFPGGHFDLIHIDGQQDEIGTTHDLEVSLAQARHILVDGFFWTRNNFLNVSEFLYAFRDRIRWYGVIPGYAGDLLIEVLPDSLPNRATHVTSATLRETYTAKYYLTDCGGYDIFKLSSGQLLDTRLQAMYQLTEVAPAGHALDIGCGRGELALRLARDGYNVTAIDYSSDAIELARQVASRSDVGNRIEFQCADANSAQLKDEYELVIAGDVVEHMSATELDVLYSRVSEHLSANGLFIVHTYPNSWYYRYEHARKVRVARSVGAHLPANPRSRYERLMHINEQSPRVLRRQLRSYFEHVVIWFSDHSCARPGENLVRRFSIAEMRSAADLFAVASRVPVSCEALRNALEMDRLEERDAGRVRISLKEIPDRWLAGEVVEVTVDVYNEGDKTLKTRPPHPIVLSYHWMDVHGKYIVFDGVRSGLEAGVRPKASATVRMRVLAPLEAGTYVLRLTVVQEWVRWFDESVGVFVDAPVVVERRV